jgi:hypothetical protein
MRADFQRAIEGAIRELQPWYKKRLNGLTFKLHDPVVEVVHSSRYAGRFYAHPNGPDKDDWGFGCALAEAYRERSTRHAGRRRPRASASNTVRRWADHPDLRDSEGRTPKLGVPREITGKRRRRLFVYEAYLNILNEGMEPLAGP